MPVQDMRVFSKMSVFHSICLFLQVDVPLRQVLYLNYIFGAEIRRKGCYI